MIARLRMRRKRSMEAELPSYQTFDSLLDACYPAVSALFRPHYASMRGGDPATAARCYASEALLHTLGTLVLALQVQDGAAPLSGDINVVEVLRGTGADNLAVLAVLVLLSIVSWAIILQKMWSYRAIRRQTVTFLDVFRRSSKFSE